MIEKVGRQFKLYKPLSRELKLAAIDSEERFGTELSQEAIVNMAISRFLRFDLDKLLDEDHKAKIGIERLADSTLSETEEWYDPQDSNSNKEEPYKLPAEILMNISSRLAKGESWQPGIRDSINAILPRSIVVDDYMEQIMKHCIEQGVELV